jgi:hypothetical protein
MDRYVSDPVELPAVEGEPEFERADLIFHGIDHGGDSYEARVFLDRPDADEATPLDLEHGYAGSFFIFGHGGCAGDEGHCDVPEDQTDPDDLRLAHPLTGATRQVIVTEALRRVSDESFTFTVVPVLPGADAPRREDVLAFESVELLTFD